MIEINGKHGGGQILRTALMFSTMFEKPIRVTNIRGARPKPGLRASHLKTIEALAEISNAEVNGAKIGSKEVEFHPHNITNKKLKIDIGTAGSITLLLQAIIPFVKEIEITGGTDVPFSPTADYFSHVFLSTLNRFGVKTEMEILRRGFYPKGNGQVKLKVDKFDPDPIEIINRGEKYTTDLYIVSTNENDEAEKFLKEIPANVHEEIVTAESQGIAIHAHTHFENTIIGADDLHSGTDCAKKLIKEIEYDSTVDSHLGDMLIPYMAIAGGKIRAKRTDHLLSNIKVVEKFINCKFDVSGRWISCLKR